MRAKKKKDEWSTFIGTNVKPWGKRWTEDFDTRQCQVIISVGVETTESLSFSKIRMDERKDNRMPLSFDFPFPHHWIPFSSSPPHPSRWQERKGWCMFLYIYLFTFFFVILVASPPSLTDPYIRSHWAYSPYAAECTNKCINKDVLSAASVRVGKSQVKRHIWEKKKVCTQGPLKCIVIYRARLWPCFFLKRVGEGKKRTLFLISYWYEKEK